ncbi:hypothetical protein AQ490_07700 [Wenjunlia vitaminophila]|uniref:Class E sortase n=1 Tax=Wenjunlia vitaminophila TaxID=76728 RepID=A0A0T6LMN5_WENVI|nr:class E sortase [Wenjunlia vitaminophila]KRV47339.1 hypothetical protein AQ490_07700 [Wenjunlia vitaminophila]
MTVLPPERDGQSSDPARFVDAVGGLADPLNDPLPGRQHSPSFGPQPHPSSPYQPELPPPSDAHALQPYPSDQYLPDAYLPDPYLPDPYLPDAYGPEPFVQDPQPVAGGPGPDWVPVPAQRSLAAPDQTVPLPQVDPLGLPGGAVPGSQDPLPGPSPHLPSGDLPSADPPSGGRAARRRTAQAAQASRAGRAARDEGAPAAAGTGSASEVGAEPAPGGRAARRRAAQEEARRPVRGKRPPAHGKRARRASTASLPAASASAGAEGESADGQPLSRLEARRAARAAKDGPAVVISRVAGELFITLGVLMLLFVGYQLWWTNVIAHRAANAAARDLEEKWRESDGEREPGAFDAGEGFAIIYIPKLDVKTPIAEGIDKHKVLDKGMVGHYSGNLKSAMPWDKKGNFALAGHRNTHGEPFRYVNKLEPGDPIVVETQDHYYVYEMTSILPQTSPSNIGVIGPVPPESGFTEPGRYITLTTCTPEFTSKYRMIVWGKMVEERPRSEGKPDALVG